jgi:hypothetical protein
MTGSSAVGLGVELPHQPFSSQCAACPSRDQTAEADRREPGNPLATHSAETTTPKVTGSNPVGRANNLATGLRKPLLRSAKCGEGGQSSAQSSAIHDRSELEFGQGQMT